MANSSTHSFARAVAVCLVTIAAYGTLVPSTAAKAAGDTSGLDGLAPKVLLKVFDEKSGKLLFLGEEQNTMNGQIISRVTTYTDLKGKKLQEERVAYDAKTLRIQSQSSRNFVTGTKVDMQPLPAESSSDSMAVNLKFQENAEDEPKTKKLASDNLYVGNVMHHLIIRNWQKLTESQKRVVVKLIAPTRLDYYSFRLSGKKVAATKKIVKKTSSKDGLAATTTTTIKETAPSTKVIVLEPDSWIIRSLVDPMEFFYEDGRLVEFRGITPVVVDDNPYRRTRFKFSYPSS